MENFTAMLTPARANGQWRTWIGDADDWDDACDRAEKANPGWNVHTCGVSVAGAQV